MGLGRLAVASLYPTHRPAAAVTRTLCPLAGEETRTLVAILVARPAASRVASWCRMRTPMSPSRQRSAEEDEPLEGRGGISAMEAAHADGSVRSPGPGVGAGGGGSHTTAWGVAEASSSSPHDGWLGHRNGSPRSLQCR